MSGKGYKQANEAVGKMKVWVGDIDDFAKVVDAVTDLANDAIAQAQAMVGTERERADHEQRWSHLDEAGIEEKWALRLSERRAGIAESLEPVVTVTHREFNRELKGSPADVLPDVDVTDVIAAEISVGLLYSIEYSGGYALRVAFKRTDGCEYRARAVAANWVAAVDARLQRELSRRRPWYWWIRNGFVAWLLCALALSPLVVWVNYLTNPWEIRSQALLMISLVALVYGSLSVFGVGLVKRVLPAFELLKPGSTARGSRVLGASLGVVAWVAALVIPLLLPSSG